MKMCVHDIKRKVIQPIMVWFIYIMYCLWCITLRYKEKNKAVIEKISNQNGSAVVCLWHDELFPLPYLRDQERAVAVVSRSRDGEILSGVLKHLGLMVARGSSSRGGVQVLRDIIKDIGEGLLVFFTVDGPRGPRHHVKKGALFLSEKCGIPIIPVRIFMSHVIILKSWDKFQLPLPFSQLKIIWGDAYYPSFADKEEGIHNAVKILEEKLNNLK